jgi:two-component system chemotaxis response regulator CheB
MNHDIIVIGASAGGLEVLLEIAAALPADLSASLFIVLHTTPGWPSPLPELLSQRSKLPARHPLHNEKILPGHIYIAPPDNHLLLREGSMDVVRGPRENGHRPAADALFRSASKAYGPRVIGVVLSGYQDCGTAGLMSIKARGGLAVVQTPGSAAVAEMPRSAIDHLTVDHVASGEQIPKLLVRLAALPVGERTDQSLSVAQLEGVEPGAQAELVCPLCFGALTESQQGTFHHFRCHVGHTFSLQALVREQSEAMERALWSAVRVLDESAALSRRLSVTEQQADLRRRFEEKARTHTQQADLIRQILLHGTMLTAEDAATLNAAAGSAPQITSD